MNCLLLPRKFVREVILQRLGMVQIEIAPTAIYDLRICPNTFDFACFLFEADVYFRKQGFDTFSLLILHIDGDHSAEYSQVINADKRNARVKNILIPLAEMYSGCTSVEVIYTAVDAMAICAKRTPIFPLHADGRHLRSHNYRIIHRWLMRANILFSGFKAPPSAIAKANELIKNNSIVGPYVTLNVRSYSYQPLRNTDMDVYLKFAEYLQSKGYTPIFIPDSDGSFDINFKDWIVFDEVCTDLYLRMAVYEQAFVNIFTSNGIHALPALNLNRNCKFINAGQLNESYPESTGARRFLADGLKVGDQPYAFRNSYFIWAKETLENLKENFETIERNCQTKK